MNLEKLEQLRKKKKTKNKKKKESVLPGPGKIIIKN